MASTSCAIEKRKVGSVKLRPETTDAAGYDRFVVRDDLGRLVKILSADNERTLFLYDDAGRPVQRIDPDSVSSYFTYDSIGRLPVSYTHLTLPTSDLV